MSQSNKYFKDIKKLFPVYGKKEKLFLNHLKEQIDEYENPSYHELEIKFGTPIEIVKSYYDTVNSSYLLKKINIKKIVTVSCIIVVLTSLFYFAFQTYTLQKAYDEFQSSVPTNYEETIEENN